MTSHQVDGNKMSINKTPQQATFRSTKIRQNFASYFCYKVILIERDLCQGGIFEVIDQHDFCLWQLPPPPRPCPHGLGNPLPMCGTEAPILTLSRAPSQLENTLNLPMLFAPSSFDFSPLFREKLTILGPDLFGNVACEGDICPRLMDSPNSGSIFPAVGLLGQHLRNFGQAGGPKSPFELPECWDGWDSSPFSPQCPRMHVTHPGVAERLAAGSGAEEPILGGRGPFIGCCSTEFSHSHTLETEWSISCIGGRGVAQYELGTKVSHHHMPETEWRVSCIAGGGVGQSE